MISCSTEYIYLFIYIDIRQEREHEIAHSSIASEFYIY